MEVVGSSGVAERLTSFNGTSWNVWW